MRADGEKRVDRQTDSRKQGRIANHADPKVIHQKGRVPEISDSCAGGGPLRRLKGGLSVKHVVIRSGFAQKCRAKNYGDSQQKDRNRVQNWPSDSAGSPGFHYPLGGGGKHGSFFLTTYW